eukprot:SAG22_NODE_77_length_22125_cov_46.140016_19_plen_56_part_00
MQTAWDRVREAAVSTPAAAAATKGKAKGKAKGRKGKAADVPPRLVGDLDFDAVPV